jgi:hypothetical protein
VILASKTTAVRYERARPGELVHMDVKKIGRVPDGVGWRAHGREMGKTSTHKKARIGYDYMHSVVDDHSRFAYSEILNDERAATTAAFFARALARFVDHGIHVDVVMTDNAWNYTHSNGFKALLHAQETINEHHSGAWVSPLAGRALGLWTRQSARRACTDLSGRADIAWRGAVF